MTKNMECQNMPDLLGSRLPTELLIDIFDYLTNNDLKEVRLVCQRWRDVTYLPQFLKKFKFVIRVFNLATIYENLSNDKDLYKRLAYENLELCCMELSDPLQLVLRSLGPHVRSLSLYSAEVFSVLNEYLPDLEELKLYGFQTETDTTLDLDLCKFKNFKSLDIIDANITCHLISNLICSPHLKMAKLSLCVRDRDDYKKLIIQCLQCHGNSLTHLELVTEVNATRNMNSQWAEVFPLLRKLQTLRIGGSASYWFLTYLIEGIPKSAPLRNCDFSGVMLLDDKLLKLIVDKWSESLENINLSFCRGITNDGAQYLGKLRHSLKVLNVAYCKEVTGEHLLEGLAANTNTTLKTLVFTNNDPIPFFADRLPQLEVLHLGNCHMSVNNRTLQSILQHQRKLRQLNLNDCRHISDEGLIGFDRTQPNPISNLKGLQSLSLSRCTRITDRALKEAFKFNELRHLCLDYCNKITTVGIKELLRNCPALETLAISSRFKIDEDAVQNIFQNLKRLRRLRVNCSTLMRRQTLSGATELALCTFLY